MLEKKKTHCYDTAEGKTNDIKPQEKVEIEEQGGKLNFEKSCESVNGEEESVKQKLQVNPEKKITTVNMKSKEDKGANIKGLHPDESTNTNKKCDQCVIKDEEIELLREENRQIKHNSCSTLETQTILKKAIGECNKEGHVQKKQKKIHKLSISDTPCIIVGPPTKVLRIHQKIIESLEEKLTSEGRQITEELSGPAVVVAVNSSRIAADVKRDLAKTGLKDIPILLLIIKATRNTITKPIVQIKDLEDSRIKEICFFLVDANLSDLHKCQINDDSLNTIVHFLKNF